MDFSTFEEGQLRCVKTLDAPVAVSAGAGSGKTFTLTQRIAWALLPGSGADGAPFLEDIDQVLAITFTDKAAGEIKSRVKATLAAEGIGGPGAQGRRRVDFNHPWHVLAHLAHACHGAGH